jgi:hypothetical protein
MRRFTLLLSVVFLLTTPVAFAQGPGPDADGDSTPDAQDSCPAEPGPPGSPTYGCPTSKDSDGDGVPDYADECPSPGMTGTGAGCPRDDDEDGVPNAQDDCPLQGAGPGEADGCPSLRALVVGSSRNIGKLAADRPDVSSAQCYHSRGALCSFRLTLTLSARSAKNLGLKKRQIGQVKVTTNKHSKGENLRYVEFRWRLSARVKRALKKAKSVTLTMAGTYARGSDEPQAFKPVTFKAVRNDNGKKNGFLDTREQAAATGPDF